jgi:hypothetical protein
MQVAREISRTGESHHFLDMALGMLSSCELSE